MKLLYTYYCIECGEEGEIANLFGTIYPSDVICSKCGGDIEIKKVD